MEQYKVYVDAKRQDWRVVKNNECEGEIVIKLPEFTMREKFTIKAVGLRQFINRFEIFAIRKALEIIKGKNIEHFVIYSDSQTAVYWARHPNVKWIPREENEAGHILEEEKLKY